MSIAEAVFDAQVARGQLLKAREAVLMFGTDRFGEPDAAIREAVHLTENIDRLDRVKKRALTSRSWAEFLGDDIDTRPQPTLSRIKRQVVERDKDAGGSARRLLAESWYEVARWAGLAWLERQSARLGDPDEAIAKAVLRLTRDPFAWRPLTEAMERANSWAEVRSRLLHTAPWMFDAPIEG